MIDTVTNNIVSDLADYGVMSKFTSISTFDKIYYTYIKYASMESQGCLLSDEGSNVKINRGVRGLLRLE